MAGYYINAEVRKMYGIPLSQLTPEQRRILKADGERRKKLIEERQKDFMRNNKRAFEDAEKLNKVLAAIYAQCQKDILADVSETIAKVKKAGGEWSYANQSALTRSRGLFEQINKELVKLGKAENTQFRKDLANIYTDQFLRTVYALGQTQTVDSSFNMLNPRLIQDTLDYPWSGAMFSDRLWLDKDRLGRNLRIGLTQSMILGEDMDRIADRIASNLDTSKYNAMRIARTETKRVTYVSQAAAFKEQHIEEVRYMAANRGDSRTCDLCKKDQGKKFKLGEEPSLPRHPNCRCWYNPITPDTFADNELNELTGSVRGAESYEKWREKEAARIKAAQEMENREKTAQELIMEKVEEDMRRGKEERKSYTLQIDALEEERDKIPTQYAEKIAKIEEEKLPYRDIMSKRAEEMDELNIEIQNLTKKRLDAGDLLDAKKISEEEYDKISDEVRQERKAKRSLINQKEDELYEADFKIRELDQKILALRKEIQQKQSEITEEIKKLNEKIQVSMDSELDLYLDISYVGDSMERYENIELFRSLRKGHRSVKSFDMGTYKDELVQMAQRMDEEALLVQKKLSHLIQNSNYSEKNTGWYAPYERKVHMDMADNAHEKALGNGLKGSWQTKFHEEGHQIDHLLGCTDKFGNGTVRAFTHPTTTVGKKLSEVLEKDLSSFLNKAIQYSNEKEGCSYKPFSSFGRISKDTKFAYARYVNYLTSNLKDRKVKCQLGILSDAMGLFTQDRISAHGNGLWGHSSSYNKDRGKAGANSETWATFCAMRVCGSKEEIEMVKSILPETWDYLNKVYSDVAKYLETNDFSY